MMIYIKRGKVKRIVLYFTGFFIIFIFLIITSTKNYNNTKLPTFIDIENTFRKFEYNQLLNKNLIKHLNLESKTDKGSVDFLLNIRKLVLFAVHELNVLISSSPSNPCSKAKNTCSKWWANPLQTIDLNTTTSEIGGYLDHDIIFRVDPGHIPIAVKIHQYHINLINKIDEFIELKIIGNFSRIDLPNNPNMINILPNPMPRQALNSYNIEDNTIDPELYTWRRHYSFMVGDYVDFNSTTLYKISPKDHEKGLAQDTYCGSGLKMLIMVSSAPTHFANRKIIRETYGSDDNLITKQVRLVFLYGKIWNQTLQTLLDEEAGEYDDIIQGDFMDSYHNLSLSHLLMYNWIQKTCETIGLPKYVLKADDDFFLNIDLALKVAYENPQYELIGTLYCGTQPIRQVAYMEKYYTPHYMYMADYYVGYLSGVAYLLRTDIIPRMLKISLTTPMIHMDDVYMTGLLPRQINIVPVNSQLFTYARTIPDPCATKKMACSSAIDVEDIRVQWNEWIKPIPKMCHLNDTYKLLPIEHLRESDKLACLFH